MQRITNIGELVTNDPTLGEGPLGVIRNAAVVFDERITWVGPSDEVPAANISFDAAGCSVIPGFVDSHAHLVFAGDRSQEFAARMSGVPYAAGGIHTTVAAVRSSDDHALRANLQTLSDELRCAGVTHFECKSGYGLTTHDELRAVRIAREFTDDVTLLAAHVVPQEFADRPDEYVDLIIQEMLPAARGIARWVDVFCDRGAFTELQTRRILAAARDFGFSLRLHANQLGPSSAVEVAMEFDCASADHCTNVTDAQVAKLADSSTVATLLPGAEFSTRAVYPSGRRLLDAGVTVALATDCNPGSSFTTSMSFCIAVAVRDMGMTTAEALWAATAGGAAALRRSDVGRLSVGARADIVRLSAPTYVHLAYRPGVPLVEDVWCQGTHAVHEGKLVHD